MKLCVNRQQFSAAFAVAASAAPQRSQKDVLRNVFMAVSSGKVELIATDHEIGIRFTVADVTTDGTGDALLPTGRMSSILRELQEQELDIVIDDKSVMLKTKSSKFKLASEDPREFPPVPEFIEKNYFRVPAPVFRQMIRRTTFATDTDSTRYALGGLLIEFVDGNVTLVSTDSRRLAIATAACEKIGEPIARSTTVIPTKAMLLLERSVDSRAEFVDITVNDKQVMMRSGSFTVISRLVEGRFPRWKDVIPKNGGVNLSLPVGPFFSAVRQSIIVTDEENRGVSFEFDKNVLAISSQASSVGDSRIEMPTEYVHERLCIVFDPKYVADFLKVLNAETIVDLELTNSDTVAVFRVDDSYTYVIMPLASDR